MANVPIKFKRVAAAFDEAIKWRRPCESSSGSEYWPESEAASLSDLVNSFIEKGDGLDPFDMDMDINMAQSDGIDEKDDFESDNEDDDDTQRKELLRDLLLECRRDNKKGMKQKIKKEIEIALKLYGENNNDDDDDDIASSSSRNGLKRNIMSHLRGKGFDAGLCKSRWEKTGRYPAGTYEYIDVNVGETRYMVEVSMAGELDIVRPTTRYSTLLNMIPSILIIEKPHVLKQIIRLMSSAMKESLKRADLHVAPWRRNGYLQARYVSPYKRTINKESSASSATMGYEGLAKKRSSMVGFEADDLPRVVSYYCRDNGLVSKGGIRVGMLGVALQGK
ncbi:uncharacterized protein LOC141628983 [Silene latifolia]|uniref:uncharacterized protein LOC141628983 n=1 Tax=Silene latifolia TaxID=37657 RepID=UPI003D787059